MYYTYKVQEKDINDKGGNVEKLQYNMEYNYTDSPSKNPNMHQWGLEPALQDCNTRTLTTTLLS